MAGHAFDVFHPSVELLELTVFIEQFRGNVVLHPMHSESRPDRIVGADLINKLIRDFRPVGVGESLGSCLIEQAERLPEDMIFYLIADIQALVYGFKSLGQCFRTEHYGLTCRILESAAALACMAVVEVIDQNGQSAPSCGAAEKKPLTLSQNATSDSFLGFAAAGF